MIDERRMEQAISYLYMTDEDSARAKALMLELENSEKTILAMIILDNRIGTTVQERDAIARTDDRYKKWMTDYKDAVFNFELLRNKRSTETIIIEAWRSLNRDRKHGNIS